jgi:carbonic anhydrase/acetyltransferase-like protein (isoleucine patch superfamily)
MAIIRTVNGQEPVIGEGCFLADNAVITGDVEIGDKCTIWFNAVVRGDVGAIRISNRVNIQDGAVIHATFNKSETHIGRNVSIGHRAIVHGARIEKNVLIGMGAIVMDNVRIPSGCMVAAGALIPENKVLEAGWIYAGIPAVKFKPLTADQIEFFINRTARNYVKYASWYE